MGRPRRMPTRTLRLSVRRSLDVDPALHPRGVPHLAAASGLVRVGGFFHAVADDEHHLATIEARSRDAPIALHRLFRGTLPQGRKARKRRKPDLEALLAIDEPGDPQGSAVALVAIGSGSRPTRNRGAWVDLDGSGRPAGPARALDLAPLLAPLARRFDEVNIEGAFRLGERLCLLQRGNAGAPTNALVTLDWRAAVSWFAGEGPVPRVDGVVDIALGALDGVPYGITDGAALDADTFVFAAAAEATDDAVADGANGGSLIGLADARGRVRTQVRLAGRRKVEGVAVRRDARDPRVLVLDLVTDADDPDRPSQLLRARWRP